MEHFDITAAPLEIERKFLIAYPNLDALRAMPDYRVIRIDQTYLEASGDFAGGRLRRIVEGGSVRYVYTYKQRISELTRHEYERDLSEDEYRDLLRYRRADSITIEKDRHIFTYGGLTYELDVYDFWDDKATLEAEVDSEDRAIPIPPCVELIREVTLDRRYNNSRLAKNRGIIE
jgi:CYTH domain-containing protein